MGEPTCTCKHGKAMDFGHRSECPVIVEQWRALAARTEQEATGE